MAWLSNTAEGRAALERAVGEAQLRSLPLHVVRAVPVPTSESQSEIESWQAKTNQIRKQAEALEQDLRDRGVDARVAVELAQREDPAMVLLRAAREYEADLLVIGIRSRSRVGKAVFGSTAQDVILGAECPVLAVKANEA